MILLRESKAMLLAHNLLQRSTAVVDFVMVAGGLHAASHLTVVHML